MLNKRIKKGESFAESEFFFDDCPICQAMKAAEERGGGLDMKELKQAFAKAKEKGAVVGGKLFEKNEQRE